MSDKYTLYHGDCLEVMARMEDNSIDTVITDPPYHLVSINKRFSKTSPDDDNKTAEDARNGAHQYARLSSGFMGKEWDGGGIAFDPATWAEVLRVAKPGAMLLAFGGTRTFHRLACAIEDAGWIIRDTIMYLYGSGFPKSHNLAKDFLKMFCQVSLQDGDHYLSTNEDSLSGYPCNCRLCDEPLHDGIVIVRDVGPSQGDAPKYNHPSLPSVSIRTDTGHIHKVSYGALSFHHAKPGCSSLSSWLTTLHDALESTVPQQFGEREQDNWVSLGIPASIVLRELHNSNYQSSNDVLTFWPNSDAFEILRRNGHSSQLPKHQQDSLISYSYYTRFCPTCQSRISIKYKEFLGFGSALKPAFEPVILAMKPLDGTFAENALRWGVAGLNIDGARIGTDDNLARINGGTEKLTWGGTYGAGPNNAALNGTQGRWPANLILSDDPEVTAGFPVTKTGGPGITKENHNGYTMSGPASNKTRGTIGYADSGSAARYFYCAKSSKSERNHGLPDGMTNKHPTVKPVSLCQYLARLTKTPTGGIVLDPFCGSGSIGIAAILEGRQFIGIDQDADSIEVARYRLDTAVEETAVTQMELELNGD